MEVARRVGGQVACDLQLRLVLGQAGLKKQKGRRGGNSAAPARSSAGRSWRLSAA